MSSFTKEVPESLKSNFSEVFEKDNDFFLTEHKYKLQNDLLVLYNSLSISNNVNKFIFSVDTSGSRLLTKTVNYVIPRIEKYLSCNLVNIEYSVATGTVDNSDYDIYGVVLLFERIEDFGTNDPK